MTERADVVVVGGGIGGLTAAWELTKRGCEVIVLDAADRAGGPLRGGAFASLPEVPLDLGAESFAVRGGAVEPLVDELGLTVEAPATLGAWGYAAGRAFPLPAGGVLGIPSRPWAADVRRAVGWPGVIRGALDRVLPGRFTRYDDVGALVRSRMGGRITDRLVAAVAAGVHSAPLDRLDVDAVAPGLRRAVDETGSLSSAVARLRAAAPPGSAVRGVDGGVHAVVDALSERLDVRRNHRVTTIDRLPPSAGPTLPALDTHGRGGDAEPGPSGSAGSDRREGDVAGRPAASVGPAGGRGGDAELRPPTSAVAGRGWRVVAGGVELRAAQVVVATAGGGEALAPDLLAAEGVPVPERGADIRLAALLLAAPELDAAPRGTGMLVAAGGPAGRRRPDVRAKALTHATAKWPWLARRVREVAGAGMHVVRLSYGRIGEATEEPTREEAVRDASALLGVDLTGRDRDFLTQHWDGSLPPPTPAYRAQVREFLRWADDVPGLAVTGGWVAGTGLAAIVDHAREAAVRLAG